MSAQPKEQCIPPVVLISTLNELASPLHGEVDALHIGLTLVSLASAGGAWAFLQMSRHIAEDWKLTGAV